MTRLLRRLADSLVPPFLAFVVASCSGAVSGPPGPGGAITVSPSSATLFANTPTTFLVSGGSGTYTVTSDNQGVIAPLPAFTGNSFSAVPSDVSADTTVNLTVRDSANSTPVNVAVIVKPRTISNVVTVTPSATQSAACGAAICSGGDAEVKVTLSQAGIPLANRTVRFDVVSGELRLITSSSSSTETLSTSTTATTDGTGTARVRARALADAASQTALLSITDLQSGFSQSASVSIAQSSNAPLTVTPTHIQFTGPNSTSCASGLSADVIVIGGRPPYQVSQPSGFTVSPTIVANSGGRITITSTGQCARTGISTSTTVVPDAGQTISVIDANGSVTTVVVHNDPAPVTAQTTPFAVAPVSVTLDSCSAVANIALVGGTGNYFTASGNTAVTASVSANIGFLRRAAGTPAVTSVPVAFSDGQRAETVTVTLTGDALGKC